MTWRAATSTPASRTFEESDYDNALKAFQKAYELSKRPEILLNIATVHERQGALPSAVAALKGYLEASPQGEHVETVKLRIQNLEKRLQEQDKAKAAESGPAPAAAPPPPAASAAPAAPPTQPAPKAHAHAKGEPNRLPAFISLGVGGVLAGASLATGLRTRRIHFGGACRPLTRQEPSVISPAPRATSASFRGPRSGALVSVESR